MSAFPIPSPLIRAVRVADLRAYLLARGWRVKEFKRPQVICFEGPPDDEGKPIPLLVPASEQLRDYFTRLEEIVSTLSAIEGRPAGDILRNIVTPTCDVLHLRLAGTETLTGTLGFGFVGQFFASLRNLLVFAACGKLRPKPFYSRALKSAVRFADRCRLRPAPVASFQADVEAPLVPPAHEAQVQLKAYPTERLILMSLMNGLHRLEQAIESGRRDDLLNQPTVRISANLCDAVLGMKPDAADVRWEASVSWSSAWPIDEEAPSRAIVFEGKAFEQIASIGRALRTGNQPIQRQLRGRIIRLSAEDPVHGDAGPLVVTLDVDNANAPAHVAIALSPEQYRQACQAHLAGQRVAIRGSLDRIGRLWQLLDVSDFQVLTEATL